MKQLTHKLTTHKKGYVRLLMTACLLFSNESSNESQSSCNNSHIHLLLHRTRIQKCFNEVQQKVGDNTFS